MDVKLENLIEKIKKDGVEAAEHTSEELINKSKNQAAQIIEKADEDAQRIIENAQKKAATFQKNAELALQQAARDTELLVKEKLQALMDDVFKREVAKTLSPDFLKELILKIVGQWAKHSQVEIVLNGEEKKKLQDLVTSSLKGKLKDSVSIKVGDNVNRGFRIGMKDSHVYYEISDDSISAVLKTFLNPNLKEIVDKRNG